MQEWLGHVGVLIGTLIGIVIKYGLILLKYGFIIFGSLYVLKVIAYIILLIFDKSSDKKEKDINDNEQK